jgi:hypothetical protein
MREGNPSNKPNTCLWCGRRLRAASTERGLQYSGTRINRVLPESARQSAIQERKEYHQKYKGRMGVDGAFFCSINCGFCFGVNAARNGFRLNPKP